MPKGKRRGKSERYEKAMQNSDSDSGDNASVFSSETRSVSDGFEDEVLQDQFEEKVMEFMDGLSQKSSQGRADCLTNISKALVSKYAPAFVAERHFTLCDCIERCLKKGSMDEKIAAGHLASIICVQLGSEPSCEEVCRTLKPILMTTASDDSVNPLVRAKCCAALSLINFLADSEMGDMLSVMRQLESIFSGSYHKGDGSNHKVTPEQAFLHAAALNAWSLLLTTIDAGSVTMMLETKSLISMKRLAELLESQHLEVRMMAGDIIALLYEIGKLDPDDFGEDFDDIISSLRELSTDSHKYRAKKDRKLQRASFRDILAYIEEDVVPEVRVKFGREMLLLDTWSKRKQYDTLCSILGPGINIQLSENSFLRDLFELADPVFTSGSNNNHAQDQMERNRRKMQNAANFKARTIAMRSSRDKRMDA